MLFGKKSARTLGVRQSKCARKSSGLLRNDVLRRAVNSSIETLETRRLLAATPEGFIASYYASSSGGTYPFHGDQTAGQTVMNGAGTKAEIDAGMNPIVPGNSAVLGYQEIFKHNIDFHGTDQIAPTDAPPGFNSIQGSGGPGHQFAVRFSGMFVAPVTGYYTLEINTDDGGSISVLDSTSNKPVTLPVGGLTGMAFNGNDDNITVLRGPATDAGIVCDPNLPTAAGGAVTPVQWQAGSAHEIQFDMNNNGGGWDYHLFYGVSSSAANATAATYDVTPDMTLVPFADIVAPVPAFQTTDLANPNGLAKDNSFYKLSASAGDGVVQLTWNNIAADSYNVYRATAAAGPFTKLNASPIAAAPGTLTYSDTGVTNGTQYFYIVTGVDNSGETPQNAGITASATPNQGPPAQVTGLSGHRTSLTTATGSWSPTFSATSYDVKRGTALNADGSLGGTITDITPGGTTQTSFTDTNAPATGTPLYYAVTATNQFGTGPASAAARVGGDDGFQASFYQSDTAGTYPFSGDSVTTKNQLSADGKTTELDAAGAAVMPTGTAVLGYQENQAHVVDYTGNDGIAPPDAPSTFNAIQGAGQPGHQFASRFVGDIVAPVTGYYTLFINTDDGGSISWANADGSNPQTLIPVGRTQDQILTLRGATTDTCHVVDSTGKAVQWIAGQQYQIQFDMNNNGGGWDIHLFDAISSTAAHTFDIQTQTVLDPGDVLAPVPTFKTIDMANPTGLAKDAPYYVGTATGGGGLVELDWNNIGADSYNVYRANSASGPFTKINTSPVPAQAGGDTYTDSGLTNGTTYFYIITGVDLAGETPQAQGLQLSGSPKAVAPGAPTLSAQGGSISNEGSPLTFNVKLTWPKVPITTSYTVMRGTTKGGPYTQLASGVTGTTYTDSTATQGQTYYYVVQAVNSAGSSPNSNEVTFNTITGLPQVANALTHHFYDNQWWGSGTQNTTGYQSPALIGHAISSPYIDTAGNKTIDLHGDDNIAGGSLLPPDGDIADNFSDIWTGQIKTDAAGSYTFHANTDDDGYMVLDGQIVATDPGGHGAQEGNAFPITLAANTVYNFQFYHSNGGGGWDFHMEWTEPGGTETIVPLSTGAGGIVSSTEDKPADPTNGALAVNGKNVTVTWTDNAVSELEYVLQRSTDPGFALGQTTTEILPFVENKGGAAAQGTATDMGLANGTYYYRLQAVNYDGASAVLNLGAATVGGGGATDTITGTAGNDAITLKKDADGTDIDWTLNGGPVNKVAITDPNGLTINGNGGTDTITFDNSNGNPLPNLLKLNQSSGGKFIAQGLQAIGAGQKVDVESSTVQINYSGASPLSTIQGYLKSGSIFSSTLASNSKFAIADNDSADPLNSGQPANTILLRPAIIGNATLSGKVGFNDFVQLARNYGKTGADWAMGDFDYDGKVDFNDLVALARNYNQSGPAATAALTPAVSADTGTLPKGRRPLSTRLL